MPDSKSPDLLLDYVLEDVGYMDEEDLQVYARLRAYVATLRVDAGNWRWMRKQASGPLALLMKAAETRNANKSGKDDDHE